MPQLPSPQSASPMAVPPQWLFFLPCIEAATTLIVAAIGVGVIDILPPVKGYLQGESVYNHGWAALYYPNHPWVARLLLVRFALEFAMVAVAFFAVIGQVFFAFALMWVRRAQTGTRPAPLYSRLCSVIISFTRGYFARFALVVGGVCLAAGIAAHAQILPDCLIASVFLAVAVGTAVQQSLLGLALMLEPNPRTRVAKAALGVVNSVWVGYLAAIALANLSGARF